MPSVTTIKAPATASFTTRNLSPSCTVPKSKSAEMNVIRGRNSSEVGDLLGAPHGDEAIHRDDLVVL